MCLVDKFSLIMEWASMPYRFMINPYIKVGKMTIKFLDGNGSQKIASAPEDATFGLRERESGCMIIAEYKEQGSKSMRNAVTIFSGPLDKATADECIDEIYKHLMEKEKFCDLTNIQREVQEEE